MNTSLVNFMGRHHLPAHISAQPPLVPPVPVLGWCVSRGSPIGRMCLDVLIKMPTVHQPMSTHFQSPSQAPGFLPASHSGSCCPTFLFIHCFLLLKVYTPETKFKNTS